MKYQLVRELAAEGFPVTVTHRVLKFSTERYYRWLKHPLSGRDYENAYLTNAAYDALRAIPPSATGSSPGNDGSGACAPSSAFGRASSESPVRPSARAHQCTTTSSSASSPPRPSTACGSPT
jgi:hypothetical protein